MLVRGSAQVEQIIITSLSSHLIQFLRLGRRYLFFILTRAVAHLMVGFVTGLGNESEKEGKTGEVAT